MADRTLQLVGRWENCLGSAQHLCSSSMYGAEGGTAKAVCCNAVLKNAFWGGTATGTGSSPKRANAAFRVDLIESWLASGSTPVPRAVSWELV